MDKVSPLPNPARAYQCPPTALPEPALTSNSQHSTIHEQIQRLYKTAELPSIYRPQSFEISTDGSKADDISFGNSDVTSLEVSNETGIDVVGWHHDLGVDDPLNWPSKKKLLNITCIFLMCIVSQVGTFSVYTHPLTTIRPFASSVFTPAIPDLKREFHATDPYLPFFVLSTYIFGYAVGPLLISPLSEVFGRVPLYHLCNTLFTICTVLCGRTSSLRLLAAARFLAGVGGSGVFALAPSSIADMFRKEKRGAIMALLFVAYSLGSSVGPIAGSYINAAWGWRWIFYTSGGAGFVVTVLKYIGLSETYEPVLRRAQLKKQKRAQPLSMRSAYDLDGGATTIRVLGKAILMPIHMLFFSRAIFLTSFLTAVAYGSMYILYSTISTTFLVKYAWPSKFVDLAYLSTTAGVLLSMIAGAVISDTVVKRRKRNDDNRPENRLLPMFFFWPLVSAGLVVYAWTAHNKIHWAVPLSGAGVFGAGAMSSMVSTVI